MSSSPRSRSNSATAAPPTSNGKAPGSAAGASVRGARRASASKNAELFCGAGTAFCDEDDRRAPRTDAPAAEPGALPFDVGGAAVAEFDRDRGELDILEMP